MDFYTIFNFLYTFLFFYFWLLRSILIFMKIFIKKCLFQVRIVNELEPAWNNCSRLPILPPMYTVQLMARGIFIRMRMKKTTDNEAKVMRTNFVSSDARRILCRNVMLSKAQSLYASMISKYTNHEGTLIAYSLSKIRVWILCGYDADSRFFLFRAMLYQF